MKVIFSILASVLLTVLIGPVKANAQNNSIPSGNLKIIEYVKDHLGKKVGRGECWDLAAGALEYASCEFPDTYVFGKTIHYKKQPLLPGDIIQFENVKVKYSEGNSTFFEVMGRHTAIIYEVKSANEIIMAEQNGSAGRKVGLTGINFKHIVSGTISFYRPICP